MSVIIMQKNDQMMMVLNVHLPHQLLDHHWMMMMIFLCFVLHVILHLLYLHVMLLLLLLMMMTLTMVIISSLKVTFDNTKYNLDLLHHYEQSNNSFQYDDD